MDLYRGRTSDVLSQNLKEKHMRAYFIRSYGRRAVGIEYGIHIVGMGSFLLGYYGFGTDAIPIPIGNVWYLLTVQAEKSWVVIQRYEQIVVERATLDITQCDADLIRLYAIPQILVPPERSSP
jgi:hypothetical protein